MGDDAEVTCNQPLHQSTILVLHRKCGKESSCSNTRINRNDASVVATWCCLLPVVGGHGVQSCDTTVRQHCALCTPSLAPATNKTHGNATPIVARANQTLRQNTHNRTVWAASQGERNEKAGGKTQGPRRSTHPHHGSYVINKISLQHTHVLHTTHPAFLEQCSQSSHTHVIQRVHHLHRRSLA